MLKHIYNITNYIEMSLPKQEKLTLCVPNPLRRGVLDTTLWDQVCQWLAAGQWFSPISSINITDRHDIAKILLKVALNTITLTPKQESEQSCICLLCVLISTLSTIFPLVIETVLPVWYLLPLILIFPLFLLRSVWRYQRGNCHYQQFVFTFFMITRLNGAMNPGHE
jgi:hypothetical protein